MEFNKKTDTLQSSCAPRHQPYQLKVFNDKADFGIKYNYSFQGSGLKIEGFKNDPSAASRLQIKKDDIVVMMEEKTIASPYDPYFYTAKKKSGGPTTIKVLRNNNAIPLEGHFNEENEYKMFSNTGKSAKISCKIFNEKITIQTSRLVEFKLILKKHLINKSNPYL